MADVGTLARKLLVDAPAVAALLDTRVYPGRLPKSPNYPAVRYKVIVSNDAGSHAGGSGLYQAIVMFDCYGRGSHAYTTAAAVYDAAIEAIDHASGKVVGNLTLEKSFLENRRDSVEDVDDGSQELLYRVSFDARLFIARGS